MLRKFMVTCLIAFSVLNLKANIPDRPLSLKDTIKDTSIQVPEALERNLDQLLVELKNSHEKPVDCNQYSSIEINYPDSVYIERLYNYPSEMELAYNQIVRSYIEMYGSRRSKSVQYMLAKGNYYFPLFEETLDRYGLPLELKYLPVIESALNPIAVSRAGATGLWQFMLRTGKMYDLEINSLVDERRDPIKATEAAARYLKDLYDIYGDWNLVIAAYNCGPGNVNKAIRRSDGKMDYWAIYNYLPKETRGYVPAFIAATYIMNYHSEHNICPMEFTHPVSVDTIQIGQNLHFRQVADMLNISIEEIRDLNPQYKKDIIPGGDKKYTLCLPSQMLGEFISQQDKIFGYNAQSLLTHRKTVEVEGANYTAGKATKTHKIKSGESLGLIAKKYGVTVAHLKRLNNLTSNNIRAGKTLVISRAAPAPKKQVVAAANQKVTPAKKKNEDALQLASNSRAGTIKNEKETEKKDFAISNTEELPSINKVKAVAVNTDSDGFFARYYKSKNNQSEDQPTETFSSTAGKKNERNGIQLDNRNTQQLANGTDKLTQKENNIVYHKVKIGETLSVIAKKYDVSAIEIIQWNNLPTKRAKIGQELQIRLPEKDPSQEELVFELESDGNDIIPGKKESQLSKTTITPKNKVTYRVRKGDSLYVIAKRFGKITAQDIKLANNLKSDKLSVGQVLNIPVN